ncbi:MULTISPECIES: DEAD/DEAH box helicase [Roseobacteraceae]|uniref:ATP-dependent RNA helicase DbpA n=1 Tax=Pseudosulfitobacter pseudonitzschiae TaxID=1402135 RepID=A0A221JWG2_9RHOB|nr:MULTISPECIES: DEAD/DEAH box helicase [Roseobacteraceae]ASM71082.1 ATP-dependent RNA helicase DbpA [Pseudosulfitobacter pseudonitzschiae]
MKQSLADALTQRGYETLTPVQEAVTDPALEGQDLLVSAQTGSGKTVGFGLALGKTLLGDSESFDPASAPLALVIAPTRELAMQVKRELAWLYEKAGVVMASCVGGMDMRDERRALDRGAHIVVATPGRLRDHIMRGSINLSAIRGVVLDEADEMLDLGFRDDLEYILGECPEDRRTLMFSATVPKSIAGLAQKYQRNAQRVTTLSGTSQHADIEYRAMSVANHDGESAIINTLRFFEAPNAIVFCNTRAMVNRITTRLSNRGFSVVALSGELTQAERSHALQAMRDGRARVCVATDVAARGIDLPNLDLVVHAELPSNHETLLHRSGRTGRAGRKGVSALIVTAKVRAKATRILKMAQLEATWCEAPGADAVRAEDEARLLADPMWYEPIAESEAGLVAKLVETYSAEQLATATVRVLAQRYTAPEDLSATSNEAPKPRAAFGPSVWFSVSGGRNQGVEVRRLLPILCKAGDVTKDDLGAIRISDDASFVEILQSSADGFAAALGSDMTVEGGLKLERLATPPAEANRPKPAYKPRDDRGPAKGGKPPYKGKDRDFGGERAPRPPRDDKPKKQWDDKPKKQWDDKPKAEPALTRAPETHTAPKSDKPAYKPAPKSDYKPKSDYSPDDKPARKGPPKSAGPVDWNDTSTPRRKKPKAGAKPTGPHSAHKKKPRSAMDTARADGAVTSPRGKARFGDTSGGTGGKPKGKGASAGGPSKGKPAGKRGFSGSGGSQPPRKPRG